MNSRELQERAKQYGIRVIRFCRTINIPRDENPMKSQLIRCSTSVGANYRSACRGQSRNVFIAKLGIAIEECDESLYWLELIAELYQNINHQEHSYLLDEGTQLLKIFTSTRITMTKPQS